MAVLRNSRMEPTLRKSSHHFAHFRQMRWVCNSQKALWSSITETLCSVHPITILLFDCRSFESLSSKKLRLVNIIPNCDLVRLHCWVLHKMRFWLQRKTPWRSLTDDSYGLRCNRSRDSMESLTNWSSSSSSNENNPAKAQLDAANQEETTYIFSQQLFYGKTKRRIQRWRWSMKVKHFLLLFISRRLPMSTVIFWRSRRTGLQRFKGKGTMTVSPDFSPI